MSCTLDIYTDYLISSTGPTTATGLSKLYNGAISHDQVTRLLTNSYLDSKDLWLKAKPLIRTAEQSQSVDAFAVLIIDDSILEKPHTDQNAMISTYYDPSEHRYVNGLNFVSLLYELNTLSLPIAVTLMEKTISEWDIKTNKYKTRSEFSKIEYLRQMLQTAQQQVAYRYLLADTWYASAQNMTFVMGLNHHFIFALESSCTFALSEQERKQGQFKSLDTLAFPDKTPLLVYLRSVKQAVLVVKQVFNNKGGGPPHGSQGTLYLVSSDTDLTYEEITTIYKRQWKVEEYHKSLKQNTSLGASPTKTPDTQANHFYASMLAYIKPRRRTAGSTKDQMLNWTFPSQSPTLCRRAKSDASATYNLDRVTSGSNSTPSHLPSKLTPSTSASKPRHCSISSQKCAALFW